MGIGVSVFLLALGAILMLAGAIGLAMTMLVFGRRDRVGGAVVEDRVVTRERDVY